MSDIGSPSRFSRIIRNARPWLLSLLGGGSLMLFSAYQERAQRKEFENLAAGARTGGVVREPGPAAVVPAPAGKPSVPLALYEEEEDEDEEDDDDDGEARRRLERIPESASSVTPPLPRTAPPAPATTSGTIAYRDGSFRASAFTEWGSMAIEVAVTNGKWSDITLLSVPNSAPSRFAVTYLVQQALAAQSDAIDGVTGATYTSDAFRDDLRQIIALSKK